MTTETKTTLYNLGRAHGQFRDTNDQRLREIDATGAADPVTEEKLNRINAEISRLTDEVALQKKHREQEETAANRPSLGGATKSDDQAKAALFALERKQHFSGNIDVALYKQYKAGFDMYLRRNAAGASETEQKALSAGSDPDGGYAVTPDMSGRIITLIQETSPMRKVANVVTIGTDALEGVNDLTDATSGWVGETESRTTTDTPRIGEWRIPVFEQYAEPRATQRLLDDAMFDVEGYLAGKIADKLSRMENTAFVSGNGNKKPRGFLTYAAGTPSSSTFNVIEQVPTGVSGAFPAANAGPGDTLINLVYALKSPYRENAVFMMKRATLAEVRKLKDGQGNYLWQPDFQMKQGGTLLGFDVVEAEDMPAIGAGSLSIAFGDFKTGYQIVDRQGIRILRDSFTAKPYVKFYTTKRTGGDVVNFEAIKLLKFAVS
jgi:HK97 family phage major capsid protein